VAVGDVVQLLNIERRGASKSLGKEGVGGGGK